MLFMPDVNVLVYAWHEESPKHRTAVEWLQAMMNEGQQLALSTLVAAGAMRIATNSHIMPRPMSLQLAMANCRGLLDAGRAVLVGPGPDHWEIFTRLCRLSGATGNLVSDAQHAAIAIEHGATWVSFDRDFAQFPGLTWQLLE